MINFNSLKSSLMVFLILLTTWMSCGRSTVPSETDNRSMIFQQLYNIPIEAGVQELILKPNKVDNWKVRIHFPAKKMEQYPLVLALHWAGGDNTYKEFAGCLAEPGLADLNAIIITPDGEYEPWVTSYNELKIKEIMTAALETWSIDENKIIVTGYSNGGNGSWFFAERYPQWFNYAIPIASSYLPQQKISVPLYVIHGAKDDLFPITRTKNYIEQAQSMGSKVVWQVNSDLSHYEGCAYMKELKSAVKWIQESN